MCIRVHDPLVVLLMEELVLVTALVLSVAATFACVRLSMRGAAPGRLPQVAAGLLLGVGAAIIAAMPYADVIPDPWEPYLAVAIPVLLAVVVLVVLIRRRRRRSFRHVGRTRLRHRVRSGAAPVRRRVLRPVGSPPGAGTTWEDPVA